MSGLHTRSDSSTDWPELVVGRPAARLASPALRRPVAPRQVGGHRMLRRSFQRRSWSRPLDGPRSSWCDGTRTTRANGLRRTSLGHGPPRGLPHSRRPRIRLLSARSAAGTGHPGCASNPPSRSRAARRTTTPCRHRPTHSRPAGMLRYYNTLPVRKRTSPQSPRRQGMHGPHGTSDMIALSSSSPRSPIRPGGGTYPAPPPQPPVTHARLRTSCVPASSRSRRR